MAKTPVETISVPVTESKPVHEHKLPSGVFMHEQSAVPNATRKPAMVQPNPKGPPIGWIGAYSTCGGCGEFIGNENRCMHCAPIQVSYPPKMMAK